MPKEFPVNRLIEWFSLKDYDRAKADSTRKIMGRFSRGNVMVQAGRYIGEIEAQEISRRGDRAIEQMDRQASPH